MRRKVLPIHFHPSREDTLITTSRPFLIHKRMYHASSASPNRSSKNLDDMEGLRITGARLGDHHFLSTCSFPRIFCRPSRLQNSPALEGSTASAD